MMRSSSILAPFVFSLGIKSYKIAIFALADKASLTAFLDLFYRLPVSYAIDSVKSVLRWTALCTRP